MANRGRKGWEYHNCFKVRPEGFLFLGPEKDGACTITLMPAASMRQEELNRHGSRIAVCINALQGISTENLEILAKAGGIGEMIESIMAEDNTPYLHKTDLKLLLPEDYKNGKT